MTSKNLMERVTLHDRWLSGEEDGRRLRVNDAAAKAADLRYTDLCQADFTGADLSGASLVGANVTGATFRNARLYGTDFRDAVGTEDADFTGAVFNILTGTDACNILH
jgi:uncharacterized protein YjbI with pentapeptide repeats